MDMEQKTGTKNNLFVGTLTHYIMSHHPDRIEDMDFINERAEQAAKDFEVASRNSLTVDEAMEVAYKTLFRGQVFSPFLTVKEVVLDLMDYTEEDEELDELYIRMKEAIEIWNNDFDLAFTLRQQLETFLPTISGSRMLKDYLDYLFPT